MESINNIISYIRRLEEEIKKTQRIIDNAPEGTLFARKSSDGKYRYFKHITESGKSQDIYVRKSEMETAVLLAKKMIAQKELVDKKRELNYYRQKLAFQKNISQKESFMKKHPGIVLLASSEEPSFQDELTIWKNQPYPRNMKYQEGLIYPTVVPDLMVRSKAEADIISRLEYYAVPYHYDEIITVCGEKIAMDLVCRNIRTAGFYNWDHRGMMDNPSYIEKTLYCEELFLKAGIIEGINLIVTTETKNHPLDIQWVDLLIRHYLL